MSETEVSFKSFETVFSLTLEKFAPLKQKYLRHNKSHFMNKTLRKAIMTRSMLKRRYNLDRTTINFEKYKKQRNIYVNLLRKSKKQYFNNADVKNLTDNKKFWKIIKPKFSNKCKIANTIILVEDEKILQDEKAIANTFHKCFTDVTHSLDVTNSLLVLIQDN